MEVAKILQGRKVRARLCDKLTIPVNQILTENWICANLLLLVVEHWQGIILTCPMILKDFNI